MECNFKGYGDTNHFLQKQSTNSRARDRIARKADNIYKRFHRASFINFDSKSLVNQLKAVYSSVNSTKYSSCIIIVA